MVHWFWLVIVAVAVFTLGFMGAICLAAGAAEDAYRAGFVESEALGHASGFQDGLKEMQRVG
ncbi:MAG: hypothetical protein WC356_02370 [Candidatus Micrarchaeia archaeon]|jgi:hypothetical protein